MILSSSDFEAAAAEMTAKAGALGLHPDYLRCEIVLLDTDFGLIHGAPIEVGVDADFLALVESIERAFAEALRAARAE